MSRTKQTKKQKNQHDPSTQSGTEDKIPKNPHNKPKKVKDKLKKKSKKFWKQHNKMADAASTSSSSTISEKSSAGADSAGQAKASTKKSQCDLCKLSYSSEKELTEHLVSLMHHTKMENKNMNAAHTCLLCNVECENMTKYRKHILEDSHLNSIARLKGEPVKHTKPKQKKKSKWGPKVAEFKGLQQIETVSNRRNWQNTQNRIPHSFDYPPPPFVPNSGPRTSSDQFIDGYDNIPQRNYGWSGFNSSSDRGSTDQYGYFGWNNSTSGTSYQNNQQYGRNSSDYHWDNTDTLNTEGQFSFNGNTQHTRWGQDNFREGQYSQGDSIRGSNFGGGGSTWSRNNKRFEPWGSGVFGYGNPEFESQNAKDASQDPYHWDEESLLRQEEFLASISGPSDADSRINSNTGVDGSRKVDNREADDRRSNRYGVNDYRTHGRESREVGRSNLSHDNSASYRWGEGVIRGSYSEHHSWSVDRTGDRETSRFSSSHGGQNQSAGEYGSSSSNKKSSHDVGGQNGPDRKRQTPEGGHDDRTWSAAPKSSRSLKKSEDNNSVPVLLSHVHRSEREKKSVGGQGGTANPADLDSTSEDLLQRAERLVQELREKRLAAKSHTSLPDKSTGTGGSDTISQKARSIIQEASHQSKRPASAGTASHRSLSDIRKSLETSVPSDNASSDGKVSSEKVSSKAKNDGSVGRSPRNSQDAHLKDSSPITSPRVRRDSLNKNAPLLGSPRVRQDSGPSSSSAASVKLGTGTCSQQAATKVTSRAPGLSKDSLKKMINAPRARDERLHLAKLLHSRDDSHHKTAAPVTQAVRPLQLEGLYDSDITPAGLTTTTTSEMTTSSSSEVSTIKLEDLGEDVRKQILSLIGSDCSSLEGIQLSKSDLVQGKGSDSAIVLSDDDEGRPSHGKKSGSKVGKKKNLVDISSGDGEILKKKGGKKLKKSLGVDSGPSLAYAIDNSRVQLVVGRSGVELAPKSQAVDTSLNNLVGRVYEESSNAKNTKCGDNKLTKHKSKSKAADTSEINSNDSNNEELSNAKKKKVTDKLTKNKSKSNDVEFNAPLTKKKKKKKEKEKESSASETQDKDVSSSIESDEVCVNGNPSSSKNVHPENAQNDSLPCTSKYLASSEYTGSDIRSKIKAKVKKSHLNPVTPSSLSSSGKTKTPAATELVTGSSLNRQNVRDKFPTLMASSRGDYAVAVRPSTVSSASTTVLSTANSDLRQSQPSAQSTTMTSSLKPDPRRSQPSSDSTTTVTSSFEPSSSQSTSSLTTAVAASSLQLPPSIHLTNRLSSKSPHNVSPGAPPLTVTTTTTLLSTRPSATPTSSSTASPLPNNARLGTAHSDERSPPVMDTGGMDVLVTAGSVHAKVETSVGGPISVDEEDYGKSGSAAELSAGRDDALSVASAHSHGSSHAPTSAMSELLELSEREEQIKQEAMSMELRLKRLHRLLEQAVVQINMCTERKAQLHAEEKEISTKRLSLLRDAARGTPLSSISGSSNSTNMDSLHNKPPANTITLDGQDLNTNPTNQSSTAHTASPPAGLTKADWLAKFASFLPPDPTRDDETTRPQATPNSLLTPARRPSGENSGVDNVRQPEGGLSSSSATQNEDFGTPAASSHNKNNLTVSSYGRVLQLSGENSGLDHNVRRAGESPSVVETDDRRFAVGSNKSSSLTVSSQERMLLPSGGGLNITRPEMPQFIAPNKEPSTPATAAVNVSSSGHSDAMKIQLPCMYLGSFLNPSSKTGPTRSQEESTSRGMVSLLKTAPRLPSSVVYQGSWQAGEDSDMCSVASSLASGASLGEQITQYCRATPGASLDTGTTTTARQKDLSVILSSDDEDNMSSERDVRGEEAGEAGTMGRGGEEHDGHLGGIRLSCGRRVDEVIQPCSVRVDRLSHRAAAKGLHKGLDNAAVRSAEALHLIERNHQDDITSKNTANQDITNLPTVIDDGSFLRPARPASVEGSKKKVVTADYVTPSDGEERSVVKRKKLLTRQERESRDSQRRDRRRWNVLSTSSSSDGEGGDTVAADIVAAPVGVEKGITESGGHALGVISDNQMCVKLSSPPAPAVVIKTEPLTDRQESHGSVIVAECDSSTGASGVVDSESIRQRTKTLREMRESFENVFGRSPRIHRWEGDKHDGSNTSLVINSTTPPRSSSAAAAGDEGSERTISAPEDSSSQSYAAGGGVVCDMQVVGEHLYVGYRNWGISVFDILSASDEKISEHAFGHLECFHVTEIKSSLTVLVGNGSFLVFCSAGDTAVPSEDMGTLIRCMLYNEPDVYLGLDTGEICVFNTVTMEKRLRFICSDKPLCSMAFAQEGAMRLLCVAARDGSISVVNARQGLLLRILAGHANIAATSVQVNKSLVYSGSEDGFVLAQNLHTTTLDHVYQSNTGAVLSVCLYGDYLFTAGIDKLVRCFSVKTQKLVQVYFGAGQSFISKILVVDNKLITGNLQGVVEVTKLNLGATNTCRVSGCGLNFGHPSHLELHKKEDHV